MPGCNECVFYTVLQSFCWIWFRYKLVGQVVTCHFHDVFLVSGFFGILLPKGQSDTLLLPALFSSSAYCYACVWCREAVSTLQKFSIGINLGQWHRYFCVPRKTLNSWGRRGYKCTYDWSWCTVETLANYLWMKKPSRSTGWDIGSCYLSSSMGPGQLPAFASPLAASY